MKPKDLRAKLLADIEHPWGERTIEVSSEGLIEAFSDILLHDWCEAVGVDYAINKHPIDEFRAPSTVIFWKKQKLNQQPIEDDEL